MEWKYEQMCSFWGWGLILDRRVTENDYFGVCIIRLSFFFWVRKIFWSPILYKNTIWLSIYPSERWNIFYSKFFIYFRFSEKIAAKFLKDGEEKKSLTKTEEEDDLVDIESEFNESLERNFISSPSVEATTLENSALEAKLNESSTDTESAESDNLMKEGENESLNELSSTAGGSTDASFDSGISSTTSDVWSDADDVDELVIDTDDVDELVIDTDDVDELVIDTDSEDQVVRGDSLF